MDVGELVGYAGAFLDMLLLASGFQSNGNQAFWSTEQVKRALSWAAFLEDAMHALEEDGKPALDEALADMMDRTPHPPGLPKLSVAVLLESRVLLLQVLLQAMGIENGQIASVVAAVVELEGARAPDVTPLGNLISVPEESMTKEVAPQVFGEVCMSEKWSVEGGEGSNEHSLQQVAEKKTVKLESRKLWSSVLHETSLRCSAVAHVDSLVRIVEAAGELAFPGVDIPAQSCIWRDEAGGGTRQMDTSSPGFWRSNAARDTVGWTQNGISYLMGAETIYKLSSSLIIFKGTKSQWTPVLDALRNSDVHSSGGNLVEIAELCFMYMASPRWKDVCIKLLAPSTRGCPSPSTTCNTHWTEFHPQPIPIEKRQEIEPYLVKLVKQQTDIWWNLSPILLAGAVATSPTLLNMYAEALSAHVDEAKATSPRCTLHASEQPNSCTVAVAERIWCLQICGEADGAVHDQKFQALWNALGF